MCIPLHAHRLSFVVRAQQVSRVRFEIHSLPVVANSLIVRWRICLVGEHEVAMVKQPRPVIFLVWATSPFSITRLL